MDSGKNVHYSSREKVLLATLVEQNKKIECKRTDAVSVRERQRAWDTITAQYNAQPDVEVVRTSAQLKKLWFNLKQRTRKQHTAERYARLQTGGGPQVEITMEDDPVVEAVESAAPHLDVEWANELDSTASYQMNPVEVPQETPTPSTSKEQSEAKGTPRSKNTSSQQKDGRAQFWDSLNTEVQKLSGVDPVKKRLTDIQLQIAEVQLKIEQENLQRAVILRQIAQEQLRELEKKHSF